MKWAAARGSCLLVVALALATLAGCGKSTMFTAELDKTLTDANRALERGEVELACAKLGEAMPRLAEWSETQRGERVARANHLLDQLSMAASTCAMPPSAGGGADFAAQFRPAYQELRRISTYSTSWWTVFTYVSMFAVGIAVYVFLRRMRRSS